MLLTQTERARLRESLAGKTFRDYADQIRRGDYLSYPVYQALVDVTHTDRIDWWRKARFGMFIHYGLYSQTGYGEWHRMRDGIPAEEYNRLADTFCPAPDAAEQWVRTAKAAGAKYAVLTTRHHEGFSLWDSKVNPFNSVNYGCHRDIVREFTEACRKYDIKIGFYTSLMDWNNPAADRAAYDPAARREFLDYIRALNVELLSNYGKIDILWYDMAFPMQDAESWETLQRDQLLRALQPDILINERGFLPEDFSVSEESLQQSERDWESCLTFHSISWGYVDEEQARPYRCTPQLLVRKLNHVCRNGGNLLLNVGPRADGSLADGERETMERLGRWMAENGEVVYGTQRRCNGLGGSDAYGDYGCDMLCDVSAKGNTVYLWNLIWPKDGRLYLSGYRTAPRRVYRVRDHAELPFSFADRRIVIDGGSGPFDPHLGISVIAMEFEEDFSYRFCIDCPQINESHLAAY